MMQTMARKQNMRQAATVIAASSLCADCAPVMMNHAGKDADLSASSFMFARMARFFAGFYCYFYFYFYFMGELNSDRLKRLKLC